MLPSSRVSIQVGGHQGLANRMFRYAYAKELQALIPDSKVTGHDFGLPAAEESLDGRVLHITHGHRHSMQSIASLVNRGIYQHVLLDGFVQRLEFYPDRGTFPSLFPPHPPVERTFLGPEHLVVHVRAGDALTNAHPDYGPVPVAYFQKVAESTGLNPVIMGQLGDDIYSESVRQGFQGCTFLPIRSPAEDFELLRSSVNVAFGVSTFGWLASWLSNTTQAIYMPLKGVLNPLQRPDVDLAPVGDMRYHFTAFPVERWSASDEQRLSLVTPNSEFHAVNHAQVREMITYVGS